MPKIGLVMALFVAVLIGISPGHVAPGPGNRISRQSDFRDGPYFGRSLPADEEPGMLERAQARVVIWHAEPSDPNPFGFIPTRWTAKPELLPMHWDGQTVFAGNPVRTFHVAGQSHP
jgi:hypothetical protein